MRGELAALTLAGALTASGASALAAESAAPKPPCFFPNEMTSWRPSQDLKSVYLGVRGSDVFRVDFNRACPRLRGVGVRLIIRGQGSSRVCRPSTSTCASPVADSTPAVS